ncbi:hypothetical protein WMY93_020897, partial [Mugilogobius chulae]
FLLILFKNFTFWPLNCPVTIHFHICPILGSTPSRPVAFLCGVCMFSPCLRRFPPGTPVSSGYSGFLRVLRFPPTTKNMSINASPDPSPRAPLGEQKVQLGSVVTLFSGRLSHFSRGGCHTFLRAPKACITNLNGGVQNVFGSGESYWTDEREFYVQKLPQVYISHLCAVEKLCSVIGSQLIDFTSATATIPDRCAYKLLEETGGIKVVGVFQERRRKDTNILDHLVITLGSNTILLARGMVKGRGYELRRSFLFRTKRRLCFGGMCGFGPALSCIKCDTAENQDADATIDKTTMDAQCDLLTGSPFSDCNTLIAPAGIITACKAFLGKYGSKDTTDCAFHQAYATMCNMAKVTLTDWRTTAQCVSSAGQCLDTACVSHEFCGLVGSEPKCLCRAIFKSAYTGNSVGGPTVCSGNSASLDLAICMLEEKNVHYNELHLKDATCKGTEDKNTGMLKFAFDSTNKCGTEVKTENSQLIFSNQVQLTTSGQQNAVITRHDQFQVDFSCYYSLPEVKNMALKIKSSSVVDTVTSGEWTYTLTMTAYENEDRSTKIDENTEILLDQTVWVELKTDGLDENLVSIVTTGCWATSENNKDATLKYDLISTPGCPNTQDSSVKVDGNGLGTSMFFSFNMFQFTGKSTDVYLFCEVSLCAKSNTPCAPDCSGQGRRRRSLRSRRSLLKDPNPGLISMSWTK